VNYAVGFRPSLVDGDLTNAQIDYSVTSGDMSWNRVFDAGFKKSGTPVIAEGQSILKLKVWGLKLSNYAYSAPGPGGAGIAILVKIPGMTSWMDVGRAEGDGPGKQDIALDGAGCQVAGVDTFDGVDADTKLVYSQVKITATPAVFHSNVFAEGGENLVPVLVRVIIKDNATGKALNFTQTSATGDPGSLRGLVGLEIVRP
jgi:hypothetical protein